MVFSKEYVSVLMTILALLLSAYPIPLFNTYYLELTFVPLLFIGRYTNAVYTNLQFVINIPVISSHGNIFMLNELCE